MTKTLASTCAREPAPVSAFTAVASAFLLCLSVALTASTWAQQPARLTKIGILSPGRAADTACGSDAPGGSVGCFVEGLRTLGYLDGQNVLLEFRFADGDYKRLPALAAELVSLRPEVIYTQTGAGAEAAANATTTIPIVVAPAGEDLLIRLAGNLARPAGNVTGMTLDSIEQDQKCLQLLKELAPRTSRVAILLDPDNPRWRGYPDVLSRAAAHVGVTLIRIDARGAVELPQAFTAIAASRADAIFIVNDAALAGSAGVRKQVVEWAMSRSLPIVSSSTRVAPDGGLVSIGADGPALARHAADYVDKILKGAKPADLPVERPSIFKLSVNVKTAKALGITIPQSLLLRADEVIQ